MAVALGERNTLQAGGWKGVYVTKDPGDAGPERLTDARNLYLPDASAGSDFYQRPGFVLTNQGSAVHTDATRFKGQGVYTHFELDGQPRDFVVFQGTLYRYAQDTDTYTDVTPVGVTIDDSIQTRVFFASMGGSMCVTDGVNRPWIATNIDSTPITGTYIDFDSLGTAWIAFGPPVVFGGCGFFILTSVNSVAARLDIAWTEPNSWSIGYQQTNYDNRWTLEQTGSTPLFGLAGTNVALYYWRQRSIGSISGAVGPDLTSTSTHDAISTNVGTEAPQTIVQFGDTIYFCDVIGRPWAFNIGSAPRPIWHQLRGIVDASNVGYPATTARVATAGFDPTLNLYCVAIWSPSPGAEASPTEWHSFDANTGVYVGRWSIGDEFPAVDVDCLGSFIDAFGRGSLVVLGSAVVDGVSGFAWSMNSLTGTVDFITTEAGVIITTEDADELTTEGQTAVWADNGDVPLRTATTDRMGYDENMVWLFDKATVLTGTQDPLQITVQTPNTTGTVIGTPTPNDSDDEIYRSVCNLDLNGRGATVTIQPTTATDQWSLSRISLVGIPSVAGDFDQ